MVDRAGPSLVGDTWVMTLRNLRRHFRILSQLAYTVALPVMWVLLFVYVFGGAMQVPGGSYVEFLVPGVLVLTVTFSIGNTALGLSDDLSSGALDRFKSQPVSRPALLLGRAIFDAVRNALALAIALAVGYAVGFRIHNGVPAAVAAVGLILGLGFAFSWAGVLLGLSNPEPEGAQTAGTLLAIPVIFASSTFVPVRSMPGWLQAVASNNPVTHGVDAARALLLGGPAAGPVIATLIWSVAIVAVALPAAAIRYRRVAR
jgi:ABC transporter DrrB family efflux protein